MVVNLEVQLSFTVSLNCLVNKNGVFLIEYSIHILPLSVTNDVPRVHTVNKCGAHIYDKYPFLKQVTSMFFYEDDKPNFQTHKNKRPNQSSTYFNPLNAELNPICRLLTLLGAHHILHVSRIRVNTRRL